MRTPSHSAKAPIAVLAALAGLAAAPSAQAAVAPPTNSSSGAAPPLVQPAVDPDAATAFAKKRGVSLAVAKARLARERELDVRGDRIEKRLGARSAGSYLDANGNLVVTTLDAAASTVVTGSDARAKRVDDSTARLDGIVKQLDRQAARGGGGATQGWRVDVPTNTVVVTVSDGANDSATHALTTLARSFGDSVRIELKPAAEAPKPADYLVGGYEYVLPNGGTCSVGFNTRDAANRDVVLTAGHCVNAGGTLSRSGYWIGAARTANYPNDDYGTFWNSYAWFWQPSPSVAKYDGTFVRVAGLWNAPPVGATVCKSGRTTGYTCGRITALNQTVVYKGGLVLHGLARHDACVEPGDSGGANISAGAFALGVTSGSSTYESGALKGKCLAKGGNANISYYQPLGEALSANGLRLVL